MFRLQVRLLYPERSGERSWLRRVRADMNIEVSTSIANWFEGVIPRYAHGRCSQGSAHQCLDSCDFRVVAMHVMPYAILCDH